LLGSRIQEVVSDRFDFLFSFDIGISTFDIPLQRAASLRNTGVGSTEAVSCNEEMCLDGVAQGAMMRIPFWKRESSRIREQMTSHLVAESNPASSERTARATLLNSKSTGDTPVAPFFITFQQWHPAISRKHQSVAGRHVFSVDGTRLELPHTDSVDHSLILKSNSLIIAKNASALPMASSTGLCECLVFLRCLKLLNVSRTAPL
jgi:hypothetical protein